MGVDTENDLGLPGLEQEKIDAARQNGWSNQEISEYWNRRAVGGVQDIQPAKPPRYGHLDEKNIDRTQGEDFWPRLMASFKSTPREKYNFWRKYRGDANTVLTPAGEILVRGGKGWRPIDEEGMSFADLADLAGDVPEVAMMMMTGPGKNPGFWSGVGKMGVKAGLGNIIKQIGGAVAPGESDRSFLQRSGETINAAMGGAASQLLAPYLNFGGVTGATLKGMGLLNNYISKRLQAMHQSDIFKEGQRLTEKTGVPLDLAELSQDPALKVAKGFGERSTFGQSLAQLQEKSKDSAALAYLQRLLGSLGGAGRSLEDRSLGEAASEAAGRSLADVQRGLKSASEQYFGFLQNAIGERQIPVNTYRETLLRQAKYYRSMQTSTGRQLADELEAAANDMNLDRAMNEVSSRPGSLNARAIQEHLQNLGEASFGKEGPKFFRNMRLYGKNRELKELHEALRQDLVAAEEAGGKARPPAKALRQAREAWEGEQSALRQLQDLPLLKFMESKGLLKPASYGETPPGYEHIEKYLVEGMKSGKISPSEISNMMNILSATSSEFPNQFTQGLLSNSIRAGFAAGKGRASSFNRDEAAKALPSPEMLQAIYGGLWQPGQRTTGARISMDLQDLLSTLERSGAPGQGIPGAPHTFVVNTAAQIASMKEGPIKSALKNIVSHYVAPRKALQFIYDPKRAEQIARELEGKSSSMPEGYLPKWARERLAPLIYESLSAAQPRNQPGAGEE